MIYGYARVSTDGQSVDPQVKQLRAAGATHVFGETASGAKRHRRELAKAIKALGDAWADTTTPHGRLMLTVLGGLAEFERAKTPPFPTLLESSEMRG